MQSSIEVIINFVMNLLFEIITIGKLYSSSIILYHTLQHRSFSVARKKYFLEHPKTADFPAVIKVLKAIGCFVSLCFFLCSLYVCEQAAQEMAGLGGHM